MAEEALKITITADNKQALAAIQKTVDSLEGVEIASVKAGGKVVKMGKDFTGLSRVIQDLPFGFNAIANNLTQILPAAGALGLAFSGVVAGLQFAQNGTGAWTRGLEGLFKQLTLTDQVNKEYVETLAKEKVNLDSLFNVAQDNNKSLQVRNQAIATLRDNYGPYLENYTDEEIRVGKATKAHDLLLEALKKESIAQAALALAAPIQQKILEYDIELINQKKKAYQDFQKAALGGVETISGGPGAPSVRITAEQRQQGVLNQFARDRTDLLKKQQQEQAKLNQLQEIAAQNAVVKTKPGGGTANQENFSAWAKEQLYLENINREYAALTAMQQRRKNENLGVVTGQQLQMQQTELGNLTLSVNSNNTLNKVLAERAMTFELLQQKQNEAFATAGAEFFTSRLNEMFTQLQNGLSIGEAVGNMFKRLAIDIALAAAKAMIFQAILGALTGGGSAAAGGAAKGGGFLKMFGKMLGFSEGGTVSGPKSGYPVMLHGTEHIVRPDQMRSIIASASQMGGGNSRVIVEGRISGQDIWLSQQRTNTFRALTT